MKYHLDDDYVGAKTGESPTVCFAFTSNLPLPEDARHLVTNQEGELIRRFKVQENCIIFRDVRPTDSGLYTIKCEGWEGEATCELEVLDSVDQQLAGKTARGTFKELGIVTVMTSLFVTDSSTPPENSSEISKSV